VLARGLKFDRLLTSAFLLSILFVNAGNYGIPFTQFAFGSEGVARAAIYFTVNSVMANTLAVYIASSGHSDVRKSVVAVLKMPLAYAALFGLAFNALDLSLPEPLARALDLAAAAALPVMLVNLGLELARAKLSDYEWRVFVATGVRLLVAPLVAIGLAYVVGMQGLTRSVSIIEESMPTAVMASLIATEFHTRPDFVTSVIVLSTLGSTVTLTLLLLFLGYAPT
jgi:predicted permease